MFIFECFLGIRQGEIILSLLFNLLLNDLDEALSIGQFEGIIIRDINLKTLLYADDLSLLLEIGEDLQAGLHMLYDYCNTWKLPINTEKGIYNNFRKGGNVTQHDHLTFGERRSNALDKIPILTLH